MRFKQQLYSVAVIAGPWNCVVDRDIRLLKAHSCCRSFFRNSVGDVAPRCSSGCGFALTIVCHMTYLSARLHLRNVYIPICMTWLIILLD